MSRFSHLEFEEKGTPKAQGPQGEPVRDERFFHERAKAAWLAGDFEEALRNYSRALEKNSAFYDGWFGQVRMLIELGEYQESSLWADKALELFPEHPELLAAKAVACARDADIDKAQAFSDNAISKRGATPYVWLARAEVLLLRRSNMAETCIRNAISLANTAAPIVRFEAGRLLLNSRSYLSAMEYLRPAVKEMPKSALVWYEFGRCQAALGFPEAEVAFGQSLKLQPGWAEAQAALSQFKERGLMGRIRAAFRRLRGS